MKKLQKLALAALGLTLCSSIALAGHHSKHNMAYTLKLFNMVPVASRSKSKAMQHDCSQFSQSVYNFNTSQKVTKYGHNYSMTNFHMSKTKMSHGIITTHWTATGVLMGQKGKKSYTKVYGRGVGLRGMGMYYGVFHNGYCRGYYEVKINK